MTVQKEIDVARLAGKTIVKATWTGPLSISDMEGFLLEFSDGTTALIGYYTYYGSTGLEIDLEDGSPQIITPADAY